MALDMPYAKVGLLDLCGSILVEVVEEVGSNAQLKPNEPNLNLKLNLNGISYTINKTPRLVTCSNKLMGRVVTYDMLIPIEAQEQPSGIINIKG